MKDMKQIFLNKFTRSEKAEAPSGWPDDLEGIEQTAEEMRRVSSELVKRMSACLLSGGSGGSSSMTSSGGATGTGSGAAGGQPVVMTTAEKDKKLRKLPESALAQTLLESSEKFTNINPSLKSVLSGCGETVSRLSAERLTWEARVESSVVERLRQCGDEEVPSILKTKKQLWKLSGELKAAKDRLKSAEASTAQQQHQGNVSGSGQATAIQNSVTSPETSVLGPALPEDAQLNSLGGAQGDSAKVQQVRAAKEDLETEVGYLKDQSLREFYRFDGALVGYARSLVDHLTLEAEYHRRCLHLLDTVLPKLATEIDRSSKNLVFGRNLIEHLAVTNRRISYVLEVCIQALDLPHILAEEGLFRIAGSKSKVDTLTSALNVMRAEKIVHQYDPYVIADSLKQYLRSLPEPLLTFALFDDWMRVATLNDQSEQLRALWHCCVRLPGAHWTNLAYLVRFLSRIAALSHKNKMTPGNLGIVFGPNLLTAPPTDGEQVRRDPSPGYPQQHGTTPRLHHQGKQPSVSGPIAQSAGESGGGDNSELSMKLMSSNAHSVIVELLISHADQFFPEGGDQRNLSPPAALRSRGSPGLPSSPSRSSGLSAQSSASAPGRTTSTEANSRGRGGIGAEMIAVVACNPATTGRPSRPSHMPTSGPGPVRRGSEGDPYHASSASTPTGGETGLHQPLEGNYVDTRYFPSTYYRRRISEGTVRSRSAVRTNLEPPQFQPVEDGSSTAKPPYQAKSFHADVYDTLFALQSLNSQNGVADYLSRVRSVYEGRTLVKPGPPTSGGSPVATIREMGPAVGPGENMNRVGQGAGSRRDIMFRSFTEENSHPQPATQPEQGSLDRNNSNWRADDPARPSIGDSQVRPWRRGGTLPSDVRRDGVRNRERPDKVVSMHVPPSHGDGTGITGDLRTGSLSLPRSQEDPGRPVSSEAQTTVPGGQGSSSHGNSAVVAQSMPVLPQANQEPVRHPPKASIRSAVGGSVTPLVDSKEGRGQANHGPKAIGIRRGYYHRITRAPDTMAARQVASLPRQPVNQSGAGVNGNRESGPSVLPAASTPALHQPRGHYSGVPARLINHQPPTSRQSIPPPQVSGDQSAR